MNKELKQKNREVAFRWKVIQQLSEHKGKDVIVVFNGAGRRGTLREIFSVRMRFYFNVGNLLFNANDVKAMEFVDNSPITFYLKTPEELVG